MNSTAAEERLINKAKGDREAFLEIYDLHFKRIYNYAYYRTMDLNEAEEITSRTFLAALENIAKFEYRNIPIAVWLYRIASNAIADHYRKKGRSLELTEEYLAEDRSASPENTLINKMEKEQLIMMIKSLPPLQQQAIILRYIQNMSYKDISQIMEKTEGAVKQLLHRGLSSLRERMVRYE